MPNRYGAEQKFFCKNSDDFIYKILSFNMKLMDVSYETEEFFTDIDSKYIVDGTCFSIIRKNREKMEISYQGKTDSFATKECNMVQDAKNYDEFVELFSNLGFYRYVMVEKTRKTYSMIQDDIVYNIILDDIQGLGCFVEFELIFEKNDFDSALIKEKMDDFIGQFSTIDLKEVVLPYRDFIAREIYHKNFKREFKRILVNIFDIIPNIHKNGIKEAICENEALLNLKLIEKMAKAGIEIIILYNDLSEDTLNYINKNMNFDSKYILKNTDHIEDISLNDTVIIKTDEQNMFCSLAFILLNWYHKE